MSSENFEFNHIVRLAGSDLAGEWYITHALTRVRGVGKRLAHLICKILDIPIDIRIGFLTQEEIESIEKLLTDPVKHGVPEYMVNRQKDFKTGEYLHVINQDLDIALKNDIDNMKKTRSYKGLRHSLGLRVRGQHTRTTGRGGRAVGVQRRKGK